MSSNNRAFGLTTSIMDLTKKFRISTHEGPFVEGTVVGMSRGGHLITFNYIDPSTGGEDIIIFSIEMVRNWNPEQNIIVNELAPAIGILNIPVPVSNSQTSTATVPINSQPLDPLSSLSSRQITIAAPPPTTTSSTSSSKAPLSISSFAPLPTYSFKTDTSTKSSSSSTSPIIKLVSPPVDKKKKTEKTAPKPNRGSLSGNDKGSSSSSNLKSSLSLTSKKGLNVSPKDGGKKALKTKEEKKENEPNPIDKNESDEDDEDDFMPKTKRAKKVKIPIKYSSPSSNGSIVDNKIDDVEDEEEEEENSKPDPFNDTKFPGWHRDKDNDDDDESNGFAKEDPQSPIHAH